MQKEPYILVLVGVLAFAGTMVWRQVAPPKQRAASPPEEASTARIAAYEDQIEQLSDFDSSLILYREAGIIPVNEGVSLQAIAVDREDRIYAGGRDTVLVLDMQGNLQRRLKIDGEVSSLAVGPELHLFVGLGNKILVFEPDAEEGTDFGSFPPNARITSLLVVDSVVFVADAVSRTVKRFGMDGKLEMVLDGKSASSDSPGFVVPSPSFDLAPSQPGTIWIVNPGRQRLEEYDLDGAQIRTWDERSGMEIANFCGCCNPAHIARLSDGSIVTSEKGILRVKLYTSRGQFLGVVAAPTQFDGQDIALDLAVDSHDRILVADPARKQIRIFERTVRR